MATEIIIQGKYGERHGWEDVAAYETMGEARADLKLYRENEPQYTHRIIRRRVRKGAV